MRAKTFAQKKHKGQIYGENGDYFTEHIQVVVNTVRVHTSDEITIAGAFLHDTLEDTDTTFDELVNEFGKEIADLVLEITHVGNKEEGFYFPKLKSIRARRIKTADRLSNIFRLENWSEERKKVYLKKSVFWETKSNKVPIFYRVIDTYSSSHHTGYGDMALVETEEEAKALQSVLDKKWDGCDGSYSIKIKPVYKKDIGLKRWRHYLCKHEWSKTAITFLTKKQITLKRGLYFCPKCTRRWLVSNREDNKLPAYFGIGYWDEKTQTVIVPKEKELIDVPKEEKC